MQAATGSSKRVLAGVCVCVGVCADVWGRDVVAATSIISITKREFHPKMENTHRCEREGMLTEWFHTLFALSLRSLSGQQFLPPKHSTILCVRTLERQGVWANQILFPTSINMQEHERSFLFCTCGLNDLYVSEELTRWGWGKQECATDYTACEKPEWKWERVIECQYCQYIVIYQHNCCIIAGVF